MTDIYKMIDELHEAVEPLKQEVLFRRYPFLQMAAGMNKIADAYRRLSIELNAVLDGVSVNTGDMVEISSYGEKPHLYKINEGSTVSTWYVELQ